MRCDSVRCDRMRFDGNGNACVHIVRACRRSAASEDGWITNVSPVKRLVLFALCVRAELYVAPMLCGGRVCGRQHG